MERKKLFNPDASDDLDVREMIEGSTTNLLNLENVKFTEEYQLYKSMVENFWIPEKISLTEDKLSIETLRPEEREIYKGTLGFLVFLDSLQTNNIMNIAQYITAPEVVICLATQTFQEAVHSHSYQYIFESLFEKEERDEVYNYWKNDSVLFERVKYIADGFQEFIDNPNKDSFKRVLIYNYVLESIYFYNGFNYFYLLDNHGKMGGTADVIRLINRDETSHVVLFRKIIREVIGKEDHKWIQEIIKEVVEQEINWTNHLIGNKVLGISESSTEAYTKYLANKRLKDIGIEPIFEDFKNPYLHLEKISDVDGGNVRTNFFESTVSSYNMASAVNDWDAIDKL